VDRANTALETASAEVLYQVQHDGYEVRVDPKSQPKETAYLAMKEAGC
jgi:hypothetical protein